MLWLYLSNITYVTRLTGIPRTEYEVLIYALKKKAEGKKIKFCSYYADRGFFELDTNKVNDIVAKFEFIEREGLDNYFAFEKIKRQEKQKPTLFFKRRWDKTKLSFKKKIRNCFRYFNKFYCPFSDNDIILSVGMNINSKDMLELAFIKKNKPLYIKIFCHDIIPLTYPRLVTKRANKKFSAYFKNTIQIADFFYCNSHYTKSELKNYLEKNNYKIPPIEIVSLGSNIIKTNNFQNVNVKIKEILKENFLIYVSTIEIRKNHQVLYEAYLKLIDRVENLPKLLFIGHKGWMVDKLLKKLSKDKRVQEKILIFDNVTDYELALLYQHCLFTLYPSFVEGYGLPIAESLNYGKYCLAANTGSLIEVGQNFIDYLDPHDVQQWVDKLQVLLSRPEYVKYKEKIIRDFYMGNSWREFAKLILCSK